MDFDESRLYYSHQQLQPAQAEEEAPEEVRDQDEDDENADLDAVRRHFREFLRNYQLGNHRYIYREKLLRMQRRLAENDSIDTNRALLEVDVAHIGDYDAALLGFLRNQPAVIIPALENAASDALQTLLYDLDKNNRERDREDLDDDSEDEDEDIQQVDPTVNRGNDEDKVPVQILLKGNIAITPLRGIKSDHMNRLLKCPGVVISASSVRARATKMVVRCPRCMDEQTVFATGGPFGGIVLSPRCKGPEPSECGPSPYAVIPDESEFVDRQTLKLQEAPEQVPTGELPRSILLAVERSLVDKAPPGTRVSVMCIPTLFSTGDSVRSMYLRVVGMAKDSMHGDQASFTPAEEEAFAKLARRKDVYEILSRSIAPSMSGSYTVDIKKSLVCMLFGGTSKRLPDGVRLRGDINVLLLGDPSMGKSQYLKFVSKVAPIGVYTSGKGSSAAGLTASVIRDSRGEFYLEGGAMVLADGGIVCIDEFDKMRPADRVAIHEAMEQQTISIAKAGITTVLNSRAAVLAAANPVFGRYDDMKTASDNIDLMTTILSRFDLIFLVRDIREEERDRMICRHVMGVHVENSQVSGGMDNFSRALTGMSGMSGSEGGSSMPDSHDNTPEAIAENITRVATSGVGEIQVPAMKKFIQYCKSKCRPGLTEESGQVLISSYVKIRDGVRKQSMAPGRNSSKTVIPITVRQLEALVRVAESLAKMRLETDVRIEDVNEALRLFRVSTMSANAVNQNAGDSSVLAGAPSTQEVDRIRSFLRNRLKIGSIINKQRMIEEANGQGYSAPIIMRVLYVMAMQGEVLERNKGKMIKRIK